MRSLSCVPCIMAILAALCPAIADVKDRVDAGNKSWPGYLTEIAQKNCNLCEVCAKNPDGAKQGQLECFGAWFGKDGCQKRVKVLKNEGAAKGFKITAFCHCEKKPCDCKGKQCP